MKKQKNNNHFKSLVFMIALIVITFFLLFKDTSLDAIIPVIKKANPFYLIIGFVLMIVFISCEATNIKLIMKSLNIKIPFNKCLCYSFVGFYFSSITPSASGGQPAQVYYMKRDNINISHSSLSLLIITVVFQIVMLVFGLFMYFLKYDFIAQNVRGIKWLMIYGVVINIILIALIFATIFSKKTITKIINFSVNILFKIKIIKDLDATKQKAYKQIDEYSNGAQYIKKNPMLLLKVTLITIIQKVSVYSIPFFVYKSFNLSGHTLIEVLAIQALLTIAVSSLPLPGAVGVTETSFMTLFKIFFSAGLILPAMLMSRMISFYAILIISGIISIVMQIKKPKMIKTYPIPKL